MTVTVIMMSLKFHSTHKEECETEKPINVIILYQIQKACNKKITNSNYHLIKVLL